MRSRSAGAKEGGRKIGKLSESGAVCISEIGEDRERLGGAHQKQGLYVLRLSVYLAEEILRKEKIEKLRNTIDEALERLTEEERFLLELRYFRRKGRLKQFCQKVDLKEIGSERAYFRKQAKLQNKLEGILKCRGFTEEKFRKEYGEFEWLMSVCRFIEQGKEKNAAGRERSLVGLLSGKSDDTGTEVWLKGKKGTNIKSRRNNAAKRTEKLPEKRERREMPQAKKVYSSDS